MKNSVHLPPHSEHAERAVLGSILIDQTSMRQVRELLSPDDFYFKKHEILFRVMMKIADTNADIDLMTVANEIEASGLTVETGDESDIAALTSAVPTALHVMTYARTVHDRSQRRKLIQQAQALAKAAYAENEDFRPASFEVVAKIQRMAHNTHDVRFLDASDIADQMFRIASNGMKVGAVQFHIDDLNSYIRGVIAGQYGVIAARPGLGKTSLALNMMMHFALAKKQRVLVVSMETNMNDILKKALAGEISVPTRLVESGNLDSDQMDDALAVMERVRNASLRIHDTPGLTIAQLATCVRNFVNHYGGIDVLILDYIQLVNASGFKPSERVQEVSYVSKSLKAIAREYNCGVIGLAQINRDGETTGANRPTKRNIKDAGQIEQDADWIVALHRPNAASEGVQPAAVETIELIVLKNRNGPEGIIRALWTGESQRFVGGQLQKLDLNKMEELYAYNRQRQAGGGYVGRTIRAPHNDD
jgi:replicative DNA helicase